MFDLKKTSGPLIVFSAIFVFSFVAIANFDVKLFTHLNFFSKDEVKLLDTIADLKVIHSLSEKEILALASLQVPSTRTRSNKSDRSLASIDEPTNLKVEKKQKPDGRRLEKSGESQSFTSRRRNLRNTDIRIATERPDRLPASRVHENVAAEQVYADDPTTVEEHVDPVTPKSLDKTPSESSKISSYKPGVITGSTFQKQKTEQDSKPARSSRRNKTDPASIVTLIDQTTPSTSQEEPSDSKQEVPPEESKEDDEEIVEDSAFNNEVLAALDVPDKAKGGFDPLDEKIQSLKDIDRKPISKPSDNKPNKKADVAETDELSQPQNVVEVEQVSELNNLPETDDNDVVEAISDLGTLSSHEQLKFLIETPLNKLKVEVNYLLDDGTMMSGGELYKAYKALESQLESSQKDENTITELTHDLFTIIPIAAFHPDSNLPFYKEYEMDTLKYLADISSEAPTTPLSKSLNDEPDVYEQELATAEIDEDTSVPAKEVASSTVQNNEIDTSTLDFTKESIDPSLQKDPSHQAELVDPKAIELRDPLMDQPEVNVARENPIVQIDNTSFINLVDSAIQNISNYESDFTFHFTETGKVMNTNEVVFFLENLIRLSLEKPEDTSVFADVFSKHINNVSDLDGNRIEAVLTSPELETLKTYTSETDISFTNQDTEEL